VDLRDQDLTDRNLSGAGLHGANLRGARLTDVDLSGADLRGADLTDARLTGGNLTGARLAGSLWWRCRLSAVSGIGDDPELRDAAVVGRDPTEAMTSPAGTPRALAFSPDGALLAITVLLPDGSYKLVESSPGGLWWAIKLCRFEPGELDPHLPPLRRLPADAVVLPARSGGVVVGPVLPRPDKSLR
jgi:hypothetical protein